jgi:protein phosphatase
MNSMNELLKKGRTADSFWRRLASAFMRILLFRGFRQRAATFRSGRSGKAGGAGSLLGEAMNVQAAVMTDIGCVRAINEDSIAFVRPLTPERKGKGYLAVVADGMGGHNSGEVASQLAITLVPEAYYAQPEVSKRALEEAVQFANHMIHQAAMDRPGHSGMGTTCTALLLKDGAAWCAHVGDSRLYLVRNGRIYLMTEDHSLVMSLVKDGQITLEQARRHPARNVITRAVGSEPWVEVSCWGDSFPVQERDFFILCSDGLYEHLDERELLGYSEWPKLDEACRSMVALAKSRGGEDNISVGLLRIVAGPDQDDDITITAEGQDDATIPDKEQEQNDNATVPPHRPGQDPNITILKLPGQSSHAAATPHRPGQDPSITILKLPGQGGNATVPARKPGQDDNVTILKLPGQDDDPTVPTKKPPS